MKTSQKGLDFIKQFEKFEGTIYDDGYGTLTVGYGATTLGGASITSIAKQFPEIMSFEVTEEFGNFLLFKFVANIQTRINNYCDQIGLTLNQNQYDAMVSLRYNSGGIAEILDMIKIGTLTKDFYIAYKVTSNGEFSQGLENRRKAEWILFTQAVPCSK